VLGVCERDARSLGTPTDRYPFGRKTLTPLVVEIQGLVLLGSLGYAGVEAVQTMSPARARGGIGAAATARPARAEYANGETRPKAGQVLWLNVELHSDPAWDA